MHTGVSRAQTSALNARPNPFANFGRFGLDGGLDEPVPTSTSASASAKRASRDAAPHIAAASSMAIPGAGARRGASSPERTKYGASPTGAGQHFAINERDRSDRMRTATGAREPAGAGRDRRDRDDAQKKEGRAEEGGWRSVGTSGQPLVLWVVELTG